MSSKLRRPVRFLKPDRSIQAEALRTTDQSGFKNLKDLINQMTGLVKQATKEMTKAEQNVLLYLKEYKELVGSRFQYLSIYGLNANELIRLIEQPDKFGNKSFVHVCKLYKAIDKIDRYMAAHRFAMERHLRRNVA